MQDNTSKSELKPKQQAFLAALLAGNSITTAAKVAGVNQATGHTWLKEPHVKAAYESAKDALFTEQLNRLRDGVNKAIDGLDFLVNDEGIRPYVRLGAIGLWLDKSIELFKVKALEARLAELEEKLK